MASYTGLFVCSLLFLVQAVHCGYPPNVISECQTKTHTPDSDIDNVKNNMPLTREGKCMMACMLKKVTLMSDDGKMSSDMMKAMARSMFKGDLASSDKAAKIAENCVADSASGAEDECDIAVATVQCFLTKTKEEGLESKKN